MLFSLMMKMCTEKSGRFFFITLEGKLESSSMNSSWTNFVKSIHYQYMKNMATWFISPYKKKIIWRTYRVTSSMRFFNTYWQPTLHYTGTLFYIMNVASHFLSAYLTYKTLIRNECVCCVWHTSVSPRIIFLTPSLIMVNTHLILTAVHWTKMFGIHLMAKWNMGKCCAVWSHMKWSE